MASLLLGAFKRKCGAVSIVQLSILALWVMRKVAERGCNIKPNSSQPTYSGSDRALERSGNTAFVLAGIVQTSEHSGCAKRGINARPASSLQR
jgi:hypothetical protein